MEDKVNSPPLKRRRVLETTQVSSQPGDTAVSTPSLSSWTREISPPFLSSSRKGKEREKNRINDASTVLSRSDNTVTTATRNINPGTHGSDDYNSAAANDVRLIPSPVQLSRIRDLGEAENVGTLRLTDLLGDPLIKECWCFNYLIDVNFVMNAIDADVRSLVKLKAVHGSWMKESDNRIAIETAAAKYPNVEVIIAHMPEPFGTHHSKLMVLIRHDDSAQVIIHTANMIEQDWRNMTQAIWRSPLLPLSTGAASLQGPQRKQQPIRIGSGERFKVDFLRYLQAYGSRLRNLTDQLRKYDFSSIRGALIASTPDRQKLSASSPDEKTAWGWPGLQEVLSVIPSKKYSGDSKSHIVVQVSSIATLGQTDRWLSSFFSALSTTSDFTISSQSPDTQKQKKNRGSKPIVPSSSTLTGNTGPTFNIVFPTASEIRSSLDGYESGGSIHIKLASAAQQKQLVYLKPLFCHWNTSCSSQSPSKITSSAELSHGHALRNRAAPHIKTYIRFSDSSYSSIDWALITSANLSTQAWGAMPTTPKGAAKDQEEVRICSWEIGVLVWPELWADDEGAEVTMVPVFGKDVPDKGQLNPLDTANHVNEDGHEATGNDKGRGKRSAVGFRMPYDLPLKPYCSSDVPWCATANHSIPDWKGRIWGGH